jgi:hypothetical protein
MPIIVSCRTRLSLLSIFKQWEKPSTKRSRPWGWWIETIPSLNSSQRRSSRQPKKANAIQHGFAIWLSRPSQFSPWFVSIVRTVSPRELTDINASDGL